MEACPNQAVKWKAYSIQAANPREDDESMCGPLSRMGRRVEGAMLSSMIGCAVHSRYSFR